MPHTGGGCATTRSPAKSALKGCAAIATTIRAQCSWQVGSILPRDRFTITPYFSHSLGLVEGAPEWDTLANDLATAIKAWELSPTNHELTVKLYNMGDAAPRRPKATVVKNSGQALEASYMREVACCLSFSTAKNIPSERGRLYVPHIKMSNSAPGPRPTQTERDKVGALAGAFTNLGGTNVDWVIYSQSHQTTKSVYKWWVDDEWDIQRRRGLRPTTRSSATVDE